MNRSTTFLEHEIEKPPRYFPHGLASRFSIALVLWLGSNALVTMVAKLNTWEAGPNYKRMSSLCIWDCWWYRSVLESGYDKVAHGWNGMANWSFHPLFPLTAYPLRYWFKLSPSGSLVLASKLELLLAIYAFILLVSDRAETSADYFRAGSLVAFNPYIIYAHAGYAEPLYFALIALAFFFAERRRWILSGAVGGLASATRIVGCVFAGAYCLFWARDLKYRFAWRKIDLNAVIGLLLCPLGMGLFMLYLHFRMGDALALEHGHIAFGKMPGNPVRVIWMALSTSQWPFIWGIMAVTALLFSGWLMYLRKIELGMFLAISVLISLSAGWAGTPRFIWWQPPFLYAIYCLLKRHGGAWLVYTAFASALACLLVVGWLSGYSFLV
jgi:hypothetical protein